MTLQASTGAAISVRAYARHRGVSHQAVMRAVRAGRLLDSLIYEGGAAKIADVSKADAEWLAKTDSSRLPNVERVKADARTRAIIGPVGGTAGGPAWLPEADGPLLSLAAATIAQKHWQAKQAELEFKAAAGQLVDAEQFVSRAIDLNVQCRTKLLGVPSKAKHALPHLTHADLLVLETLIREALADLTSLDVTADRTVA